MSAAHLVIGMLAVSLVDSRGSGVVSRGSGAVIRRLDSLHLSLHCRGTLSVNTRVSWFDPRVHIAAAIEAVASWQLQCSEHQWNTKGISQSVSRSASHSVVIHNCSECVQYIVHTTE